MMQLLQVLSHLLLILTTLWKDQKQMKQTQEN